MRKWHFNTIRVNTMSFCHEGVPCHHQDDDLSKLIQQYTSKHYVVIIAQHDYGAGRRPTDGEVQHLRKWWALTAGQYKDNPYVWFNPINEPTAHPADGNDTAATKDWYNVSTSIADVIHAAAPDNMLVFDGHSAGQDKGTWACSHQPGWGTQPHTWFQLSGGITYGTALQGRYGKDHVAISPHFYGQWGGNKEYGCLGPPDDPYKYWREDMKLYLSELQRRNVPVVAGEWGAPNDLGDESWVMGGSWTAAHVFMKQVAPNERIKPGSLNWHCTWGDGYALASPDDYCLRIDPAAYGGKVLWQGKAMYDYALQVNP